MDCIVFVIPRPTLQQSHLNFGIDINSKINNDELCPHIIIINYVYNGLKLNKNILNSKRCAINKTNYWKFVSHCCNPGAKTLINFCK